MACSYVRRSIAALGAIVLIAALSSCTDDSDADPEASESPSASSSPSETTTTETPDPGPTEPPEPAGMGEPTKKGAELLVRYYWELVDYAQKTGEVRKLKTLSDPTCAVCNDSARGLRGIYRNGGFIRGAQHHLSNFKSVKFQDRDGDAFRVDATLHRTRQRARVSKGAKLQTVPPGTSQVFFLLGPDADGALVVDYWEVKPQP